MLTKGSLGTHLDMQGIPYPIDAILKSRRKVIMPILRYQHFHMKKRFKAPGVPMEKFNHLTIPGRYHPIEVISMIRRKAIESILKNL